MSIFLGIILTLIVFTFIVFIHEMGHFLTARFTGMKVEEFGIGIPPKAKVLGKDKKATEYTLNWLPIGGFVRIKWEDPGSDEAWAKDAFSSKKWWARALVLIAWVTMNFILAIVIFFGFFLSHATPIGPNLLLDKEYGSYFLPSFTRSLETWYITHSGISLAPLPWSVSSDAGILPGDSIVEVDGQKIRDIDVLKGMISKWEKMRFSLSGTGWMRTIDIVPKDGKIWSYLRYEKLTINKEYYENFTLKQSLTKSIYETYALSHMTFDVLTSTVRKLISPATPTERREATDMLSGPIGIGSAFVDVVHFGVTWKIVFSIVALLSINLWVLNILPFPALDGWRLLSTTVRSIIGWFTHKRSLLDSIEYVFHTFGMITLLALSLLIAVLDVWKLF
jgi:regulator of sigma E protease